MCVCVDKKEREREREREREKEKEKNYILECITRSIFSPQRSDASLLRIIRETKQESSTSWLSKHSKILLLRITPFFFKRKYKR